jgi:hypothetical protein
LNLPKTWFSIMNSRIVPVIIQEHVNVFEGNYGWAIFPLGGFFIFSLMGTFPKHLRASWLIPLVWFFLALSRIRHAPMFAVVASIALADFFPYVGWANSMVVRGSKIFALNSSNKSHNFSAKQGLIPSLLILITIFLQLTAGKVPVLGKDWAKLDSRYWPVELIPQLQLIEEKNSAGAPILNDMLFGGFLIYYTPNLRVFIDDRCELYGDEGLLAYANADCDKFGYWSDKYGVSLALAQQGSTMDSCLKGSAGWTVVGKTIPATLYKKRIQIRN